MPVAQEMHRPKHETDPKAAILEASKEVANHIKVTGNDLLICVYERPTKVTMVGAGGKPFELDMSQTSRNQEDKFQGTVGLVIERGPGVLHYDNANMFPGGKCPDIGDWVMVPIRDSVPLIGGFKPNTRFYRLAEVQMVRMILQDPDIIM